MRHEYFLRQTKSTNNKDTEESKSSQCSTKRCQVCQYTEEIRDFEVADSNKCDICKGLTNCNADFTICKFRHSSCSKQYVESDITNFSCRYSNYSGL